MEDRKIRISRSRYSLEFPADFLLLAAMNPCKCGFYPDLTRCTCTESEIHGYLHKISQPLLDRMDLCAEMLQIPFQELTEPRMEEPSGTIRVRVETAHRIQRDRYKGTLYRFNGDLDPAGVERYCSLGTREKEFMEKIYQKLSLTARGYHRILKVARTIADMDRSDKITEKHLAEAVCCRAVDKKYWN